MNTTLYYREGNSDKVYSASIVPDRSGLFTVHFAYGRRGSTLTTGTKTQFPVSEADARKIFDKLISEKMSKGYTQGADGTPYTSENAGARSGVLPQLLNEVGEHELERLFNNDNWCAQRKFDGRRMMVRKGDKVEAINRKGLVVGAPQVIIDQVAQIPGEFILDGEAVGDILYVFDILPNDGTTAEVLGERLKALYVLSVMRLPNVHVIYTAYTAADKLALCQHLIEENAEGIVFKRLDARYTPGRPNIGGSMLKHKFYATLSAIVTFANDKRSVQVGLFDGEKIFAVGNVTILPNHAVPDIGEVVEIRYLYATEGEILYQPIYLGPRSDIAPGECLMSQLKFKGQEDDT